MGEIAAKLLVAIVAKLMTDTFLSRVLIACLDAWAKKTDNKLDDKVVAAMADALGVPVEKMPPLPGNISP